MPDNPAEDLAYDWRLAEKSQKLDSLHSVVTDVATELIRTIDRPDYPTYHHGYAIIHEEMDELWSEVKKRSSMRDKQKMRTEAIQVAAAAIRFVRDLT